MLPIGDGLTVAGFPGGRPLGYPALLTAPPR